MYWSVSNQETPEYLKRGTLIYGMVGDGRAEKPFGDSEAAQRQVIAEG